MYTRVGYEPMTQSDRTVAWTHPNLPAFNLRDGSTSLCPRQTRSSNPVATSPYIVTFICPFLTRHSLRLFVAESAALTCLNRHQMSPHPSKGLWIWELKIRFSSSERIIFFLSYSTCKLWHLAESHLFTPPALFGPLGAWTKL